MPHFHDLQHILSSVTRELINILCLLFFYEQAIYWLGPFIGGVAAAVVYRIVHLINRRADKLKAIEQAKQQQLPLNAPDLQLTNF